MKYKLLKIVSDNQIEVEKGADTQIGDFILLNKNIHCRIIDKKDNILILSIFGIYKETEIQIRKFIYDEEVCMEREGVQIYQKVDITKIVFDTKEVILVERQGNG